MTALRCLLSLLLLCSPALAQERSLFGELLDLGPEARAAWPELAGLVDGARRVGGSDVALEGEKIRKAWYGGGANYDEAKRDREGLGQALDALVSLELASAMKGELEAADRYRRAHETLRAWINKGLSVRFESEAPFAPPELESAVETGRSYGELLGDLSDRASVLYGMVPATLTLMADLAAVTREGYTGRGSLSTHLQQTMSLARAARAEQERARRDAMQLELARAAARVSPEAARRAAQGRADAAALRRERERSLEQIGQLERDLDARIRGGSAVMAQELAGALQVGRREARSALKDSDAAGVLARRARGPYFLLIFVDGLRPDVIEDAAAQRDALGNPVLPWFDRLLSRGRSFESSFGIFPSVTTANTVALMTGALPERSGVPSNAIFVRETRTWTRFLGSKTSRQVDDSVPSRFLHEYFPVHDRFTPLMPAQRGVASAVLKFPRVIGSIFGMGWPDGVFLNATRRNYSHGNGGRDDGAKLPPRCSVLYLGWYDHVSHAEPLGGRSAKAFEQLQRYDENLSKIEGDLERLGIADQTYTILFSDHGMISCPKGEGNTQIPMNDVLTAWGLPINKGAVDNGNGPHVIPETEADLDRDASARRRRARLSPRRPAVVRRGDLPGAVADVAGNGTIGLYLRHRSWRGPWGKRNLVADLRAYELSTEPRPVDLLDRLARVEGVRHALAREGERSARVVNPAGESVITWEPGADGLACTGRFAYRVEKGEDPLGLGALADGVYRTAQEWLTVTVGSCFPGGPYLVGQAFAANKDLDVTLCARPGFNFSAGDHHLYSDHGYLCRDSIRTTLIVAGPDVEPGKVTTPVRTVDLLPTVLDLAGIEPGDIDGRSLAPLLSDTRDEPGLIDALGGRE